MPLTVLSVAFPFAEVTADPVGGAEQVLSRLDRAIVQSGGRSIVIAAEGSRPAGTLLPVAQPVGDIDESARCAAHASVRALVAEAIARHRPDVVHLHGLDFDAYLPPAGPPVLVTLHLPLDWYARSALEQPQPGVSLVPVSEDQVRRATFRARLARPIENGVELDVFRPARKRRFSLALGRICPEKGFHLALDAARQARMSLLIAGAVFPYEAHRRYFEEEIAPRLDNRRRWIGPVTGTIKRTLLAEARCLVAPSLAPETSSLVAREALASGTPVVALRSSGAIAETIDSGRTGVLADRPEALADAIREAGRIDPVACRDAAQARFSAERMIDGYFEAYHRLAAGEPLPLQTYGAAA